MGQNVWRNIPKKAVYIFVLVFSIALIIGNVVLFERFNSEWIVTSRQQSDLEDKILTDRGILPTERYKADMTYIIARSPMAESYAELAKREGRLSFAVEILGAAFVIWPLLLVVLGAREWNNYWQGKGIDPVALQIRRNRMRVVATLGFGLLFTILIIAWRFTGSQLASYRRFSYLQLSLLVAMLSVGFIHALWKLLLSGDRVSAQLRPMPLIYRFSVQAGIVAIIAFVTGSDLYIITRESDRSTDSLIFLGIQSVAWLATVVSLGSVMLGYLRLPQQEVPRAVGRTQEILQEGFSKSLAAGGQELLSRDRAELSELSGRIRVLVDVLQSPDSPFIQSNGSPRKKQRLPKSDELISQRAELIRQRLLKEVQSLTNRGNLNLIIGSVTSLIAATILWMLVARAPVGALGSGALVGYYLPRMAVAVFIEVFSFFFLRLYRNGLSEIMYYQNELTSLELRTLALEIAALSPANEVMPQLLQDISKTDRNFVLKAGESTVELERIKVDQENIHSLFDSLLAKVTEFKDVIKKQ
jgi:hypothetical protein